SSRYTTSGRRYDYVRFNTTEVRRDRDTRSSVSTARAASLDAERDFQSRTGGVRTYDYPGSSRIHSYEQDLQARRVRLADGVRRDAAAAEPVHTTSRSDGVTGSTRV